MPATIQNISTAAYYQTTTIANQPDRGVRKKTNNSHAFPLKYYY
jgi:hypothetical protein